MTNIGNAIKVKITKSKEETLLSKIVKLVENIEGSKGNYVRIADKVSKYYTPIVHILAFVYILFLIEFNKEFFGII